MANKRSDKLTVRTDGGMFRDLMLRLKLIVRLMGDNRVNPLLKIGGTDVNEVEEEPCVIQLLKRGNKSTEEHLREVLDKTDRVGNDDVLPLRVFYEPACRRQRAKRLLLNLHTASGKQVKQC